MAQLEKRIRDRTPTPLDSLRAEVLRHAVERADLPPGLFTLTVPTGGGKTLASLSFALAHAVKHGLRRVIYVIPYTSIIEQTAEVFRAAVGPDDVLEHHASFDWERARGARRPDDESPEAVAKLQRAAENWDVPIVVTTAVQFFESLFSNRPSRCRKLHNVARSVVVLDEVQTLPVRLLRPSMAALDELSRHYRTSVVLCTATQPALRQIDGAIVGRDKAPIGFAIDDGRELAPDPQRLYNRLRRVAVERPAPFSIVTFTPATSIAITAMRRRDTARAARWRGGFAGGAATVGSGTITAGTMAGSVAAVLRASCRQVNSCCGASPWRRATTDTTAPGASVSSTIRARSSTLQRRRPIAPLITSRRRTGPGGSSLWSSLDTKRSSRSDRYSPSSERTGEGEVGTPHTSHRPLVVLPEHQGSTQADDGAVVGEDAADVGAPFDLAVQALERILWKRSAGNAHDEGGGRARQPEAARR
jgi:hypothetical protein